MLFGIRNKKGSQNKQRKSYDYENNEENEFDQSEVVDNQEGNMIIADEDENENKYISNKENITKKEHEFKPVKKEDKLKPNPVMSFNYEEEHDDDSYNPSLLNKKRNISVSNIGIGNNFNVKIYDEDMSMPYVSSEDNLKEKTKDSYIKDMDIDNYERYIQEEEREEELDYKNIGKGIRNEQIQIDLEDDIEDKKYAQSSANTVLQKKIEEIKLLKEKKRLMEPHDEKYDQDFVELKQVSTGNLIQDQHDVFQLKQMEDQSDSEKEILQWEMEKLKHGMSAKWSIKNNTQQPKKEKQHKNLNEIFTKINTNIDIDAIINRISEDIQIERIEDRLDTYKINLEDNANRKVVNIHKVDSYVNQYKHLKQIYLKLIKDQKKHNIVDYPYHQKQLGDNSVYFSD